MNTIWISPFYKSPMTDGGYDVSNFTDVDPMFGTLEDFKDLIKTAKENGNVFALILHHVRLVVDKLLILCHALSRSVCHRGFHSKSFK